VLLISRLGLCRHHVARHMAISMKQWLTSTSPSRLRVRLSISFRACEVCAASPGRTRVQEWRMSHNTQNTGNVLVPAGWTRRCLHTSAESECTWALRRFTDSEVAVTAIPTFALTEKRCEKTAVFLFGLGCCRRAVSFAVLSPIVRRCILPACTILKLRSHRTLAASDQS
jgi:hypothetical protein